MIMLWSRIQSSPETELAFDVQLSYYYLCMNISYKRIKWLHRKCGSLSTNS